MAGQLMRSLLISNPIMWAKACLFSTSVLLLRLSRFLLVAGAQESVRAHTDRI